MEEEVKQYQQRRRVQSVELSKSSFLFGEIENVIKIPSLTDMIMSLFGKSRVMFTFFDQAEDMKNKKVMLPPQLIMRIILTVSNNPKATERDLNMMLFSIVKPGCVKTQLIYMDLIF